MGIAIPDEAANKTSGNKSQKDTGMDQVLHGLKAHMKSLGQEISPEIENYLSQKAGSSAQTIKMASQRMESAQKATTRLQADIAQQKAVWKRFQDQIVQEYDAQRAKYQERMVGLQDALKKAEEDFNEAKKALQTAAKTTEENQDDELMVSGVPTTRNDGTEISPKRKTPQQKQQEPEDPLSKRLKQEVQIVSDEDGEKETTKPFG